MLKTCAKIPKLINFGECLRVMTSGFHQIVIVWRVFYGH